MNGPNFDLINQISCGDETFKAKLLSIIKDEAPKEISSYRSFKKDGGLNEAAALVHKLKHKISILAMSEGYQIAADYETSLRNGSSEGEEEFEKILMAILNFIKDI